MESNKYDKKKKTKIVIFFIVFMVVCFFAGFAGGMLSDLISDGYKEIDWTEVYGILVYPVTAFFIIMIIGGFVFSLIYWKKVCKEIEEASKLEDDDFEDALEVIEKKMDIPLLVEGTIILLSLFLFGFIMFMVFSLDRAEFGSRIFIPTIVTFLINLGLYIFVNNMVVEKIKDLHPEKFGSVMELNFRKKWMDSLDEAEAKKLGKRATRAYTAGMGTAMCLWVISLIGMMSFNTGIFPVFICVVFMLVLFLNASTDKKEKNNK